VLSNLRGGRLQQTAGRNRTGRNVFGRETELALLDRFVSADDADVGLVLTGGPGVGKTTLWQSGTELAAGQRHLVLAARPGDAETGLSFAGLADLLEAIDVAELSTVPSPQRRALEVALLRAEPEEAPPELFAIAAGFLSALRVLSKQGPLLIAVDDVNWLDRSSAEVLVFAARRLRGFSASFLLARRPGKPTGLERALEPQGLDYVEVGPLSLGAARALLSERLGLSLPRRVLRETVETSRGNPLFLLELGRMLAGHGAPDIGAELPIPDVIEELFGARIAALPRHLRRLLLAVALAGELTVSQLTALGGADSAEDALDSDLLLADGERVRTSHPLLAAAARTGSTVRERSEMHAELARVVGDDALRARHLALAQDAPDGELAATVAGAAATASARGARQEAVELAEHALRLTPPESPARSDRILALAEYLDTAGEPQRVTDLLTPELSSLPPGSPRARAWLLLSEGGHIETLDDYKQHLGRALAESEHDPTLRACVVAKKSSAVIGVERIREAEAEALEVLPLVEGAEPDAERLVLLSLAWARGLSGRPIDDLCERFEAASRIPAHMIDSPDRVAGQRLIWRGELGAARGTFTRLLAVADERGEAGSYAIQRLHLCELALRAGDWEEASSLLDEWAESAEDVLVPPMYERCRALLAVGRGVPDEAERWATEAIARAEATGVQFDWLEALRARGIAGLLAHDPGRALGSLRTVWDHTEREGVDEPGAFPVAPDLVEALVELREPGQAELVVDRLRRLATEQQHPWGLATTTRCAGLIRLAAAGYDPQAAAALLQAADDYRRLGLRFDRARTLLSLGRGARRRRQWGTARRSLDAAARAFEGIGSDGWAEQTRSELARIGGRRPGAENELTPSEARVAGLAAEGLSNKEIAASLVVTVQTVEAHLSHAYAKLGVHSRGQLARRLDART
jgi:DNA-binding CsgD family transcriptional regulator/tetratricopeptide (TPR) repeat protein